MASNVPLKNLKTFVCYTRLVAKSGLSTQNRAVNLYSSVDSNVETSFRDINNSTYRVPGRPWKKSNTYFAHVNLRKSTSSHEGNFVDYSKGIMQGMHKSRNENMFAINNGVLSKTCIAFWQASQSNVRSCSTGSPEKKKSDERRSIDNGKKEEPLSRKEMLKKAMKDYGSTVIIFYVGISLISLGSIYLLVSSGLDIVAILQYLGLGDSALSNKLAAGASTFVVAYAVHMLFTSVRISITLGAAPFIVRYLRNKGFLKKPSGNK